MHFLFVWPLTCGYKNMCILYEYIFSLFVLHTCFWILFLYSKLTFVWLAFSGKSIAICLINMYYTLLKLDKMFLDNSELHFVTQII